MVMDSITSSTTSLTTKAFADLDNDGLPDDIDGSSTTGLVADTDDDGDNYTDQKRLNAVLIQEI